MDGLGKYIHLINHSSGKIAVIIFNGSSVEAGILSIIDLLPETRLYKTKEVENIYFLNFVFF